MKQAGQTALSPLSEQALADYELALREEEDLAAATICNYLSDLRHFVSWCESTWKHHREEAPAFRPEAVTTPTITDYRTPLQQTLFLKPDSVNRSLIGLKRYFVWLVNTERLRHDPAKVVKLVGEEVSAPRHLDDQAEQALVAAVTGSGSLRNRAIILLLLHICSEKRHAQLTGRGLGYLVKKYAEQARVHDVSPHDLRHRFGYRMAASTPLHRLAQLMGHDSLDTTMVYVQAAKQDLQQDVERIAWV